MFGSDEALRTALPQYHVDYREKLSDGPLVRWSDRLMPDGTWPSNLFQFYIRVIQRLAADLKLPFQLDHNLSRKGETIVHIAIREALVNALIHADYRGQGGIVIEKYQDRIELSNPGSLLISLEQLLHGNISECRNKILQTLFTMIGAAEKAGSGIDKIWKGWESQHWRQPIIRECVQPDRVAWTLPMISLIPKASLHHLQELFEDRFSNFDKNEIQALVTADLEDFVDNARMRQITGLHAADITLILQHLVSKEALTQEGLGRWTRYRLPLTSSVHNDIFPDEEWDDLMEMAKSARESHRLCPSDMEKTILMLCKNKWLTRNQLGNLLDRNSEGLRSRFLTQMVSHGLLKLRYPNKPNRADQAYQSEKSTA